MSSQVKPLKLYGKSGPNPPKVAIILAELSVPFETVDWAIADVKKPEYVALNPNGRLPTIIDPNKDLTLWESGAIIEYLVETYDTDHKLSFKPGTKEHHLTKQWLFFQTTGQGPYYGQAAWFKKFHPEFIPSAFDRYIGETNRVMGVLNGWLEKQKEQYGNDEGFDGPWLVGNKLTYADLAFITWQLVLGMVVTEKESYDMTKFPLVNQWINKMLQREQVKKVMAEIGWSTAVYGDQSA